MSGAGGSAAHPSYRTAVQRLDEHGIGHRTVVLQDSSLLLISQRGARLYGPFRSETDASENWMPEAFRSAEAFAALITSQHWNIGGERVWIGPEIQYMIPVRSDYWGSYDLPAAMDPGEHSWEAGDGGDTLTRRNTLQGYNLGSGQVDLDVRISVTPAAHPLRFTRAYGEGVSDVRFAGYTQRVELTWAGGAPLLSESWNLAQVRPGGQALISANPLVEVTDYYEPSADFVDVTPGAVRARITGDRRYKIGVKAPHVSGRVGYFRDGAGDESSLLVRNFANDPSSVYAEEPDFSEGVLGDSIHLYNDDGALGGFGELEARGRTIGGATGRRSVADEFTSWWFFGTPAELEPIALQLLGVSLETANLDP
jgi:hypothetical protein